MDVIMEDFKLTLLRVFPVSPKENVKPNSGFLKNQLSLTLTNPHEIFNENKRLTIIMRNFHDIN
jgi:hypothetical protein